MNSWIELNVVVWELGIWEIVLVMGLGCRVKAKRRKGPTRPLPVFVCEYHDEASELVCEAQGCGSGLHHATPECLRSFEAVLLLECRCLACAVAE